MDNNRRPIVVLGGIVAAAAVAIRLPLITATRPLGYDDGVYASSVMAMRNGTAPFRDIFSSQGPSFLPTLRLFDIAGFEQPWAPRLAMLAAGVVIGLAVFVIALRVTAPSSAAALGITATTSMAVIVASGPLESDGVAVALGVAALAVAVVGGSSRTSGVAIGVLAGLAIAAKSLLILPAAIAAAVLIWKRSSWHAAALAAFAGVITGFAVTIPFGIANVWDQYVAFQLDVGRDIAPLASASFLGSSLLRREIVVVGLAAIAAVVVWTRRHQAPREDATVSRLRVAALTWLIGAVAIVLLGTDLEAGYQRYMAFLIVPIVLLVATVDIPAKLIVTGLVVLLPLHVLVNAGRLDGQELDSDAREVIAALEALPSHAIVVGDEPSLLYAAGRASPPWLTDTSFARIRAGYLNESDVVDALAMPETCALLIWSGRFRELAPDLAETAARLGYTDRTDYDPGHTLLRRATCDE